MREPGETIVPTRPVWIDSVSGQLHGHTRHYQKAFRDLYEVFEDGQALGALVAKEPDAVAYEVFEHRRSDDAGDIVFGTSIVYPRLVGREFNMTRGHRHQIADRAELYYCIAGYGLLLLLDGEGRPAVIELTPGATAYVPPHTQHRSVNVSSSRLVTLFCYPSDAGQDYDVIEAQGGMSHVVVTDEARGWRLDPNPRFAAPGDRA